MKRKHNNPRFRERFLNQGLNNSWKGETLNNRWVITSYELYDTEKQALRSTPQAITKEKAFNSLNSDDPNPTTKELKKE